MDDIDARVAEGLISIRTFVVKHVIPRLPAVKIIDAIAAFDCVHVVASVDKVAARAAAHIITVPLALDGVVRAIWTAECRSLRGYPTHLQCRCYP